jgi:hypothetical protein
MFTRHQIPALAVCAAVALIGFADASASARGFGGVFGGRSFARVGPTFRPLARPIAPRLRDRKSSQSIHNPPGRNWPGRNNAGAQTTSPGNAVYSATGQNGPSNGVGRNWPVHIGISSGTAVVGTSVPPADFWVSLPIRAYPGSGTVVVTSTSQTPPTSSMSPSCPPDSHLVTQPPLATQGPVCVLNQPPTCPSNETLMTVANANAAGIPIGGRLPSDNLICATISQADGWATSSPICPAGFSVEQPIGVCTRAPTCPVGMVVANSACVPYVPPAGSPFVPSGGSGSGSSASTIGATRNVPKD